MGRIWTILMVCCALWTQKSCADPLLKNTEWQKAVQTPEDRKRLAFFQSLYEKFDQKGPHEEIPRVFHVIWLGPSAFPAQSAAMMRTWLQKHPGWQMKLWTDRDYPSDIAALRVMTPEVFPLKECADIYYSAEDFEERAIILRYAILHSEGGVYIDHDAECLDSLEPLRTSHDFFCGLELPGSSVCSSSVNPSWHLIGATPGHPILLDAQKCLIEHFKSYESLFPGSDEVSVANRMVHRSAQALSIAIEKKAGLDGRRDRVLPPDYFNAPTRSLAKYALLAPKSLFGRRIEQAQTKEKMEEALRGIHIQLRICLYLIFALAVLNLFLGAVIVHLYRKNRKRK